MGKSLVSDASVHVVYMNMSCTLNFFIIIITRSNRSLGECVRFVCKAYR